MQSRFTGDKGRRVLVEALKNQRIVSGKQDLAEAIADVSVIEDIPKHQEIITQDDFTNDVYFILLGEFSIFVNGRHIANRSAGELVGEMTAVEPTQKRSATVSALENSVVAKVSEENFDAIGKRFPEVYKSIAQVLAKRLLQRNSLINHTHQRIRVFIICSKEAKSIAELIQSALQFEDMDVIVWKDNVFKISNYFLQSLEDQVDQADFAIAIAHGDDITHSRDQAWPAPRDNVIFELGLFMGRLGRSRAILMEPREEKLKLPSDLAGITTIGYKFIPGPDESSHIAPAVYALRTHIKNLGPQ